MSIDPSASRYPSLLAARLPTGTLLNQDEKAKWGIIAETIKDMIQIFKDKLLNTMTYRIFEMLEKDLIDITSAITGASKKQRDHDEILRYLRICRRKASLASDNYKSKKSEDRDAGYEAATILEENLYNVFELVDAINEMLNNKV